MDTRELGIYIHIPFCVRKCNYCDFLSFPCEEYKRADYVEALCSEIRLRGKHEERVTSIFFGGGTPSLLEPVQIGKILDTVKMYYSVAEDVEITMECNPGTADPRKLEAYRTLGINRLSMGAQSCNDEELKLLGRIHTKEGFFGTFRMAREAGFDNINVDLMAALPGQTIETFTETLKSVIALGPEHMSVYSLIIEEGTPFFDIYEEDDRRRADGEMPHFLPDEESERKMYALTLKILGEAGFHRYEISNYAKEGKECRHNNNCWKRVDYLGFGIGAASLYQGKRWDNILEIDRYITLMNRDFLKEDIDGQDLIRRITEHYEVLSREDQMAETMFLGLRRMEGVSEAAFENEFRVSYNEVYGPVTDRLVGEGLMIRKDGRIRLTMKGLDVSNYCMAKFLPEDE